MAQRADVKLSSILSRTALTTSATVGVDKTFSPVGFNVPGVSRYVDRSGSGIAALQPFMTLGLRLPTKASRLYRATMKLGVPTAETVTASTATGIVPVTPVAYTPMAILEMLLPERSSLAERDVLLSLLISALVDTINASDGSPTDSVSSTGNPFVNMVRNYDAPY